jgi:site-specific DNA-methyltransferase (adenine-specific)
VYREIVERGPRKLADLMQALLAFLGRNDMMAYLVIMAIRLVERSSSPFTMSALSGHL